MIYIYIYNTCTLNATISSIALYMLLPLSRGPPPDCPTQRPSVLYYERARVVRLPDRAAKVSRSGARTQGPGARGAPKRFPETEQTMPTSQGNHEWFSAKINGNEVTFDTEATSQSVANGARTQGPGTRGTRVLSAELLGEMATLSGPFLVSRTGDEG